MNQLAGFLHADLFQNAGPEVLMVFGLRRAIAPHSFGGAWCFGRNGFRHLTLLFRLVSVIFRHMDIMQPIYEPHTRKLCRVIP